MLKKTLQTEPSPRFPQARPLQGAGWEGTCCDSSAEKAGVTLVSREKELEEWAKTVTDASIERECHSLAKFTARAGCAASNKRSPSWRRRILFSFDGIFSPSLFDLMNSPQLRHLWHCSGCWLCPTCSTFYHVGQLIFWSEGCACIMKEHLGVWCVRAAPWIPHGHSVLSDWHQGQPSTPSPSSKPPFPQQICLFLTYPSMMKHPLPCR